MRVVTKNGARSWRDGMKWRTVSKGRRSESGNEQVTKSSDGSWAKLTSTITSGSRKIGKIMRKSMRGNRTLEVRAAKGVT